MRFQFVMTACLLVLLGGSLTTASDSSSVGDHDESEMAQATIFTVAAIHAGEVSLEFVEDPATGTYASGYTTKRLVSAGADARALELAREDIRASTAPIERLFQTVADSNADGIVSLQEALDLRHLYEFGMLYRDDRTEQRSNPVSSARRCGVTVAELGDLVKRYNELVAKAEAVGLAGLEHIASIGESE